MAEIEHAGGRLIARGFGCADVLDGAYVEGTAEPIIGWVDVEDVAAVNEVPVPPTRKDVIGALWRGCFHQQSSFKVLSLHPRSFLPNSNYPIKWKKARKYFFLLCTNLSFIFFLPQPPFGDNFTHDRSILKEWFGVNDRQSKDRPVQRAEKIRIVFVQIQRFVELFGNFLHDDRAEP